MNNNITINIYDKQGKTVEKTYTAVTFDLMFGTVQKLMELTKIEESTNPFNILKAISGSWSEIVTVLAQVFPNVTAEEWERVKVKELLPVIVGIAKSVVADIMSIPTDPKN